MEANSKIPDYLFILLMILLFAPLLQSNLNVIKTNKLYGHIKEVQNSTIGYKGWMSGDYQSQKEEYLKNNFGFRNWAIRLDHQWAYSAFRKPKAWAVIGKESYLYEPMYIDERKGWGYLGNENIGRLAKKIKAVEDTLNALGKAFFFVITPSKADYFPEYIWEKDQRKKDNVPTNYGTLKKEMIRNEVTFLDFNKWFLEMKDTIQYPLFPKTGIHYSDYGAAISANRIIKEIERQLDKDLPEFEWDECNCTPSLSRSDRDLENILNLIFRIPNHEMCYPKHYVKEKGKYKPRSITISDSFFWQMMSMGISEKIFNEGQFWLYNRDVHPGGRAFSEMDMNAELEKAEVVFIMETPGTMKNHLNSFVNVLYDFYFKKEISYKNESKEVVDIIERIKADDAWLKAVKEKANSIGSPLNEVLINDAKFLLKEKKK